MAGRALDTLVRYHTGYEADADDRHDVRLLCERFAVPLPDGFGGSSSR